jgi:hypothetical protein
MNKKRARRSRVLTEQELDEIGARLEHTPQIAGETPCTRERHLEIDDTHVIHEVNFNLFERHRGCVHVQG